MSYENCGSRKTSKRALNGCHRMAPPAGRGAAFVPLQLADPSLGVAAMAIVANMLAFGRGNR